MYATSTITGTAVYSLLFLLALISLARKSLSPFEKNIAWLNIVIGFIHVASALAIGWISYFEDSVWEAPSYQIISVWQNTTVGGCSEDGRCYVAPKVLRQNDVPIAVFAVLFGLISGGVHIISAAYDPIALTQSVISGSNGWRWVDYTFSASLMIFVIACLSAVVDVTVLVLLALFQGYLLINASFIEKRLVAPNTQHRSDALWELLYACLFYCFGVWGPIVLGFYQALHYAPGDTPGWIKIIVWGLFTLYSGFIMIMVYFAVWKVGTTENIKDATQKEKVRKTLFLKQELSYMFLSIASKLTLHWTLYTGILGRTGVLFTSEQDANDTSLYHRSGNDDSIARDVGIAAGISIVLSLIGFYFCRKFILTSFEKNPQTSITKLGEVGL